MLERWKPQAGTLSRWDPFSDLLEMRSHMDRLFGGLLGGAPAGTGLAEAVWAPAVDVLENKDSFVVKAELPGMKQEDIQITLADNTLTLKGERRREKQISENGYSHTERAYGAFQRSFALPAVVDGGNVRAKYKDGVLEIELPKREEAKPKEIKVQVS